MPDIDLTKPPKVESPDDLPEAFTWVVGAFSKLTVQFDELNSKVNKLGMNGEREILQKLADSAPVLLSIVEEHKNLAKKKVNDDIFREVLKEKFQWLGVMKRPRLWLSAIFVGALTGGGYHIADVVFKTIIHTPAVPGK